MERDSIRKIVLAEIALFKGKNFDPEEGSGPINKLETLEVLTRPEVYNASPDAIQKSINNEFKEVTEFNSSIAASLLMGLGVSCGCCDDGGEENPFEELATADEETKKEFQFMTDFLGFLANNPAAFGLGEETKVGEAFGKLKESFANQDAAALKEGLKMFRGVIMSEVHSCVHIYVEDADPIDGTVTFDFVEDKDQKEFCEYLKMPLKPESMIFAKNCRFRNGHPEKGKEYYLNIVDLKDEVTFKEKSDHAVIGLEVDFSEISYNPFYDNEEDIDEDPDGDDLFEGDELSEINPEALKKVKGFLDSLGN